MVLKAIRNQIDGDGTGVGRGACGRGGDIGRCPGSTSVQAGSVAAPTSADSGLRVPRRPCRRAIVRRRSPPRMAFAKDEAGLPFAAAVSKSDLDALKQALDLVRHGKSQDATDFEHRVEDSLARHKLVEWAILRSDDNTADFASLSQFHFPPIRSWPSLIMMFRKRAEAMLWQEHADLASVRVAQAGTGRCPAQGTVCPGPRPAGAGRPGGRRTGRHPRCLAHRTAAPGRRGTGAGDVRRSHCAHRRKARMNTKLYASENETRLPGRTKDWAATRPPSPRCRLRSDQKAGNAHDLLDRPAGQRGRAIRW